MARSITPNQEVYETELEQGENLILLKVSDYTGAWGFYCSIVSADGLMMKDIKIGL